MNKEERLIQHFRNDNIARILTGIAGIVFLSISAFGFVIAHDATQRMQQASLELKIDYLQGFTMATWFSSVLFLVGMQMLMTAILGNPLGKLAVRLWDRVQQLEKKSEQGVGG